MRHSRWRAALAGLAALLVLGGCLDSKVDDEDVDRIVGAIEREVPGVTAVEVTVHDALNRCCGFDVSARTDPAEPAAVRAMTRQLARVAWRHAPEGVTQLSVAVRVGADGCAPDRADPTNADCWLDHIQVSADAMRWFWGAEDDPSGAPPASARSSDQSCGAGPDLPILDAGFRWNGLRGYLPDVEAELRADHGLADDLLDEAADEVAGFVWSCYPAELRTLTLTVKETVVADGVPVTPNPTDLRAPVFEYDADGLAQRFGPRPADLPG